MLFLPYRGVLNLDNALAVGHSARYSGEPNGESYMEVTVRDRVTSTAQTHILKANHPDDARNWVHDFRVASPASSYLLATLLHPHASQSAVCPPLNLVIHLSADKCPRLRYSRTHN